MKDDIQQDLIFDVSEEYWKLLDKIRGILITRKEKIYNLISNPIEEQRKVQIIPPEIKKVLDKYSEVILKEDWDISNYNLVEYEIHLEYNRPIKSLI